MAKKHASSSADQVTIVTQQDLPLSCPYREHQLWNMHPRVYLPIEETGEEVCPYCGEKYRLKDFIKEKS